jgi:hypothetical protein
MKEYSITIKGTHGLKLSYNGEFLSYTHAMANAETIALKHRDFKKTLYKIEISVFIKS